MRIINTLDFGMRLEAHLWEGESFRMGDLNRDLDLEKRVTSQRLSLETNGHFWLVDCWDLGRSQN